MEIINADFFFFTTIFGRFVAQCITHTHQATFGELSIFRRDRISRVKVFFGVLVDRFSGWKMRVDVAEGGGGGGGGGLRCSVTAPTLRCARNSCC